MKNTIMIKENIVFKKVLKNGKYMKGKYLNIHIINSKINDFNNRLGICVSKKNGNSVQRNKLKRWIREIYKLEEDKLKKEILIVILMKKNINFSDVDFYKIKDDIISLFQKLEIYDV